MIGERTLCMRSGPYSSYYFISFSARILGSRFQIKRPEVGHDRRSSRRT
jgi:hypothetical protein